jgi:hypothetical protein
MKNYALIDTVTTLVVNVIAWDGISLWRPPTGHTAVATAEAGIGWTYANGTFTPPPAPPPGPPIPPQPDYIAFWDALIASSVYASIRTQSMASLPMNTLATEFIALLGDAKAGRANEAAIQASMSAVFSTGTFTDADAEEFTAALATGYLDDTYTLGAE